MTRKLLILNFLCLIVGWNSYGQIGSQRIQSIKSKLDSLGNSTMPGLNQSADLSFSNVSIQSFLRTIAESHLLNIQVDPTLDIKVTTNFTSVLVKDVLVFLCDNYSLDVRFLNNIMFVSRHVEIVRTEVKPFVPRQINITYDAPSDLLSMDLRNDTLSAVLRHITRLTGRNVVLASDRLMSRMVNCFIQNASFEPAMDKMALANAMVVRKTQDGFFILSDAATQAQANDPRNIRSQGDGHFKIETRDSLISIEAFNVPILDIIKQASDRLKVEFIMAGTINGSTSLNLRGVSFSQMLAILFRTTNYTFRKTGGIYIIGERVQEGLRKVEVVRLEFRTVEGVDKEIPTELAKGVEVKMFKDLNSLILTGSTPVIDEIKKFLLELDKPVPNIQIELTVIDLKKGYSIQTGIQAFLSDSLVKTQGQILPGNVTLNSQTINSALSNLATNGVINLGRVAPNFYVTLKALEDNNNIDIRSTPKLSTMNGNEATLTIGRSQYYVEQTSNVTGGVAPITTVAQRFNKVEANLSMMIKPVVSGNEHITLDFEAEFSDFIPSTIANAPPGNSTRKFKSKIRVKNGETLLFGGLEQESQSQASSGVPLLSRIPVIKWLFSSRTKANQKDQLIVLIKPTVVY